MRQRSGARTRALCFSVAAFASSPAFAGSFRAAYRAPEACPDRAAFVRAVEQRLPGWQHIEGPAESLVSIVIRRSSAGFAGRLSLDRAGRVREVREIEGPRCESVVRGLAVVTAVALDPTALLTVEPPAAVAPERPEGSPPPPRSRFGPEPAPRRQPLARFGFGAGFDLLFGPAPSALYGPQVHAELGDPRREFLARMAVRRLATGVVTTGNGSASFELTAAEIGGCYRLDHDVALLGCLLIDAGVLEAAGERLPPLVSVDTSSQFWAAGGGRFGTGLRVMEPLELEASAGLLIPFREHSYTYENPTESEPETAHTTSPWALSLRIDVSVILP